MNIQIAQTPMARIAGQVILLTAMSMFSSATPTGSGSAAVERPGTVAAQMFGGSGRIIIDVSGPLDRVKAMR